MKKPVKSPVTENHIKHAIKYALTELGAHHFPAAAGGYAMNGISDILACYKGRFIAIEAKRPGRRGERNEGLTDLQKLFGENVEKAGGLFFKVDDYKSLEAMCKVLEEL